MEKMKQNTLFREFFRYVMLNICGMIGISCYIFADTLFVANGLGADGLAALNLAIPVYTFVHGCGIMLGMGGATKYSIFRGQKKYENANRLFSNVIQLAVLVAVIFMLLGGFFSDRITSLLGADSQEVFVMTKTYLRIILFFAPVFIINDVLTCFVRNDGNPRLSMTVMLLGSFSNIILDYIFIFPLKMGILGAALATGLASVIGICILSRHWVDKRSNFHWRKTPFSLSLVTNTITLGLPSMVAEVASGIVMIAFNFLILNLRGNIGVAAYGVVANLSFVVTEMYTGIAQGIQPMVSQAHGFGKQEDIKKIFKYAIRLTLLISGGIYLLIVLFTNPIVEIFNSEQNMQLQQMAAAGLKQYFLAIPFAGFNIVLATYFTSTERALPAQVISLLRGLVIIIPAAFVLSDLFAMTGIWLSYPVTEVIVSLIGIALYLNLAKKLISMYGKRKSLIKSRSRFHA